MILDGIQCSNRTAMIRRNPPVLLGSPVLVCLVVNSIR